MNRGAVSIDLIRAAHATLLAERERVSARAAFDRDPFRIVSEIVYPQFRFEGFHRKWFETQWNARENGGSGETLILAPRGHAKSTVCTVGYTVARILINPDIRILLVSRTSTQAERLAGEIRAHLENNPAIIATWGALRGSPWTDSAFTVAGRTSILKEATLSAMGIMGPIVSMHVDLIICDDVLDFTNTRTEGEREKTREWVGAALSPCLEPGGLRHWIGTRYNPQDYYGATLLRENRRRTIATNTATRRAILDEATGRVLWPARFTCDAAEAAETGRIDLVAERDEHGPAIFAAQYLNETEAMLGMVIKPEYIAYYELSPDGKSVLPEPDVNADGTQTARAPIAIESMMRATGTDQAITEKETGSKSAVATVGYHRSSKSMFLLPGTRHGHWDPFRQEDEIENEARARRPFKLGVEDVGYQRALAIRMRRRLNEKGLSATTQVVDVPRRLDGDKVTRVNIHLVPTMARRRFYVMRSEHADVVREMLALSDRASETHRTDAIEMAVGLLLPYAASNPDANFSCNAS